MRTFKNTPHHMIRLIGLFCFGWIISLQTFSQSIQRDVIGSAGMVTTYGNYTLSFTVGEPAINTLNYSGYKIHQGFQHGSKQMNIPMYLICYLQGAYSPSLHAMNPMLLNQGMSSDATVVDTITLALHAATPPYAVVTSKQVLLPITGVLNTTMLTLPGNYYLVIKHRNTIETWSSLPYQFTGSPILIDFSYQAQTVYGSNQVEVEPGVWAFYSGDINQDGATDAFDFGLLEPDITNAASGYVTTDLNGDGIVDAFDYLVLDPNIISGVTAIKP